MTLQECMIQFRAKNRLTQDDMAKLCGTSKQTIYSVENGLQKPSKTTRAKIELVLKGEKIQEGNK